MMIHHSIKYKAIVHYTHFCKSLRKVANIYKISKSALHKWLKQGDVPIVKKRNKKSIKIDIVRCIQETIKNNPSVTMNNLASIIASECNIKRSKSQVHRYVKNQQLSYKKMHAVVDYKHDNSNIAEFCNAYLESEDIVCIDEMGFYLGCGFSRHLQPSAAE